MTASERPRRAKRKKKRRLRRFIDRFLLPIAPPIIGLFLRLLYATFRTDPPHINARMTLKEFPDGFIIAFWHRVILLATYAGVGSGIRIMISQHKDGEYIAKAVEWIGIKAARGSSTRGYVRAIREVLRENKRGALFGVTPDGPRGPRYQVQPGIIYLARMTGLPILCVGVSTRDCWVLRTWDQFVVPKPFARIRFQHSEPIYVPRSVSEEEQAELCERIRSELIRLTEIKGSHE